MFQGTHVSPDEADQHKSVTGKWRVTDKQTDNGEVNPMCQPANACTCNTKTATVQTSVISVKGHQHKNANKDSKQVKCNMINKVLHNSINTAVCATSVTNSFK